MAENEPRQALTRVDLGDELDFALGNAHVFPSELTIEIEHQRRELQPRVMQVLVALSKARPNVVSRNRLVAQCWDGRIVGDDAINRCILALRHVADQFSSKPFEIETLPRVGYRLIELCPVAHARRSISRQRLMMAGLAAAMLIGGSIVLGGHGLWALARSSTPTVLVSATSDDPSSRALAQDLAVKLAVVESARPSSMHLVGGNARSDADLVLDVRQVSESTSVSADFLLKRGNAGGILWSREFSVAPKDLPELKQQVASTAAQVLDCALEAERSKQVLGEQSLKDYLTGCAQLADPPADSDTVVQVLRNVVAAAPRFSGGWAKLLYAETRALEDADSQEDRASLTASLMRDGDLARKTAPGLAEMYLAKAALAAPADFVARSRLLDSSVEQNPDDAQAWAQRSSFLQSVGRLDESIIDARRAVMLSPLSPSIRGNYILQLAFADRLDAARAELAAAERLWPGARSLVEAQYIINLRVGDPAEALRLLRSGEISYSTEKLQVPFLEARIDRTPARVEAVIEQHRREFAAYPEAIQYYAQTLAEFGRKEELLKILLNWRRADLENAITGVLFRPAFADLRRDSRFIRAADRLGLLTYWRTSGDWPDFCFEPGLRYNCRVEAEKLTSNLAAIRPQSSSRST